MHKLWRQAAAVGLLAGFLAGCGTKDADEARASRSSPDSSEVSDSRSSDGDGGGGEASDGSGHSSERSTTTTAPTTTTTTAPPTTTTTAPPPPPPPPGPEADGVLRMGESGDAVLALQQRLTELGYWLSAADGSYGLTTQQAVLAFQKAEGLGRDGVAGPETLGRLQTAGHVTAASTSGHLIEIDLARQLVLLIDNGRVEWAFNASTGKPSTPTPPGSFTITRQINGMRHSELGWLWMPKYFNGGIAIHGSDSVPGYAASHGCTRVSNPAIEWLWASGQAEIGTPVWVH